MIAFVTPAFAADKDEEKAKEAAVAFLKAVKAKDLDAVMKVSAAPFAHREGGAIEVLKDEDALKKWLKGRLDDLKDTDKVPTSLESFTTFANLKDKIKDEAQGNTVVDLGRVGGVGYGLSSFWGAV